MTYCVCILLDAGMVFASDSRTNAGVDHISTFCKMKVYERPGDRVVVIMTSGNLSFTQNALNMLELHSRRDDPQGNIWACESMFDVATLLGQSMREVRQRDGAYMDQNNIDFGASFIVGGQIKGERMRLFRLYTEGNFIEATPETPFFQIGEIKYGRPIIDRVITPSTSLIEAAKCTLVSFDSTMRSNISVGLPIDLTWYERDALNVGLRRRIVEGDAYFDMIHKRWGEGLRRVFSQLPDPDWNDEDATRAAQYQGEIFK